MTNIFIKKMSSELMTLTCALLLLASQSHVRRLLSILALCITRVYST